MDGEAGPIGLGSFTEDEDGYEYVLRRETRGRNHREWMGGGCDEEDGWID